MTDATLTGRYINYADATLTGKYINYATELAFKGSVNAIKLANEENTMKLVMEEGSYGAFRKFQQKSRRLPVNAPITTKDFLSIKSYEWYVANIKDCDRSQYDLKLIFSIDKDGREMEMVLSMFIRISNVEHNISLGYNASIPYSDQCEINSSTCIPIVWWTTEDCDDHTEKPLYDEVFNITSEFLELFVTLYDAENVIDLSVLQTIASEYKYVKNIEVTNHTSESDTTENYIGYNPKRESHIRDSIACINEYGKAFRKSVSDGVFYNIGIFNTTTDEDCNRMYVASEKVGLRHNTFGPHIIIDYDIRFEHADPLAFIKLSFILSSGLVEAKANVWMNGHRIPVTIRERPFEKVTDIYKNITDIMNGVLKLCGEIHNTNMITDAINTVESSGFQLSPYRI